MLWGSPVAAVFIKTYCYLIERGRNSLYTLFRTGCGWRNSWKYFSEFLCTDVGESVFSCKHRFLAAAVTGFTGSSSRQWTKWRTQGWLFICLIMSVLLLQPQAQKIDNWSTGMKSLLINSAETAETGSITEILPSVLPSSFPERYEYIKENLEKSGFFWWPL